MESDERGGASPDPSGIGAYDDVSSPEESGPSAGDLDSFDLGWAGGAPTSSTGGWDDLNSFDLATFGAPPDPSGLPPDGDIPAPEATPSPTPTPEPPGPVMLVPDTDSPQAAPPDMEPPVEQGEPPMVSNKPPAEGPPRIDIPQVGVYLLLEGPRYWGKWLGGETAMLGGLALEANAAFYIAKGVAAAIKHPVEGLHLILLAGPEAIAGAVLFKEGLKLVVESW